MAAFSKQHYIALAKIVKEAREGGGHSCEIVNMMAVRLADYLASDNPRFDRAQFATACGLDPQTWRPA